MNDNVVQYSRSFSCWHVSRLMELETQWETKAPHRTFLSSDVTEKERDSLSWTVLEWRWKKISGLIKPKERAVDFSEKIEINVNETKADSNLS